MDETPLNFSRELAALGAAAPSWPGELVAAVSAALEDGSGSWLLALGIVLVAGFAGERAACIRLATLNDRVCNQTSTRWLVVMGLALFRVVFDLAGVVLFGVFAWIALKLSLDSGVAAHDTLQRLIVAIVTFRANLVIVRAVLSPATAGIRPIALPDEDARALYRWTLAFIAVYVGLVFTIETLTAGRLGPLLIRATLPAGGVFLSGTAIAFIWSNRERLARLFTDSTNEPQTPSVLRQMLGQSWPMMMSAWMVLLWANWSYSIFTADVAREQSVLVSWWITLLFPVGDRLIHALLRKVTTQEWLEGSGFELRRERFVTVVMACVRIIFVLVALIAVAVTWNLAGTDALNTEWGSAVVRSAVEIGLVVLVAYVLYEVVMSMLDQHMPRASDESIEVEGEGGGAGATRQETLAPLLRGTFLVLLALIVILTVLSAIGVQILPLIAGASIIGVAIGFGSQKLVQDIISGVFFLVDDAFRRGEYVEVGAIKGTVEKISIRSMQLRHHMGPLHTIPFGEIRHLTNFSRDWVMMKLKLRLTYDTDVEKVRKLVKKLGQQLLEDPELGPLFMEPLKSQGVYSMEDDSAVIIRVKFMTRPGDQFTVRKTVYARIMDLFEREGIEFAHRVVSVRLDGPGADELNDEQRKQIAGAALPGGTPAAT